METKYSVEDMRKVFEKIEDPTNWKNEINALIPHHLFGIAADAVEFYTATKLEVVGGPEPLTGRILVHAPGYYNGPAN